MAFNAASFRPRGFKVGVLMDFTGTPGTAIFETGELEANPGRMTFISGVKPVVDATANAITVAVGYRNDTQAIATYTAEITTTARTGFADFRNEARYQRVRVKVTGAFTAAQGVEPMAVPGGI